MTQVYFYGLRFKNAIMNLYLRDEYCRLIRAVATFANIFFP